mmetsp:Transcript_61231/g.167979  ORF Transcript_61231/g.167979 Transcript_61231/m.167979 type:complete len:237 (-) Transcript_61231:55-765(-)
MKFAVTSAAAAVAQVSKSKPPTDAPSSFASLATSSSGCSDFITRASVLPPATGAAASADARVLSLTAAGFLADAAAPDLRDERVRVSTGASISSESALAADFLADLAAVALGVGLEVGLALFLLVAAGLVLFSCRASSSARSSSFACATRDFCFFGLVGDAGPIERLFGAMMDVGLVYGDVGPQILLSLKRLARSAPCFHERRRAASVKHTHGSLDPSTQNTHAGRVHCTGVEPPL